MIYLKKFNEGIFSDRYKDDPFDNDDKKKKKAKNKKSVTLQKVMDDFYEEYETSYIDGNTHGVIVKLIEELKNNGLIEGKWDDSLSGSN